MALILFWLNEWAIIILYWLFIPAFIISVISFVCSLGCSTRHKKIFLILHSVNILIFALWLFNPNDKCNANIMEKHYRENGNRMDLLYYSLYNRLKPKYYIDIEFEHGKVSIFHISNDTYKWDSNWNPSEEKIDSLLLQTGLDRAYLNYIKKELKDMHCLSISLCARPDYPFTVGFRRIGLGEYSYRIYNKALSLDEQKEVNEDCSSILYTPYVVFEYAGGAIGNQCFPDKEQYIKSKMNYKIDSI